MTYFEAESIKQDFVVSMQFADACGKTIPEAYAETARKYSAETLTEALAVLNKKLQEQQNTNRDIFTLAVRLKEETGR